MLQSQFPELNEAELAALDEKATTVKARDDELTAERTTLAAGPVVTPHNILSSTYKKALCLHRCQEA